jgi:transposase-like protein
VSYITLRGVVTETRPYRDLSQQERAAIIKDFLTIGSKETCQKWNISSSTLHHVRWHNKKLEQKIEDEHFKKFGL